MSDLRELYQELIIDHSKNPRNAHKLPEATCSADGYNPLCGDKLRLFLRVEDGVIKDASFEGSGCAISTASASLMTEMLKGQKVNDAKALFKTFHYMVTGSKHPKETGSGLGKLVVFAGVSEFPARVKCATLAWHTLKTALDGEQRVVSTE